MPNRTRILRLLARKARLCNLSKRPKILPLLGIFGLSSSAYLAHDFFDHPRDNTTPIKCKKIFFFPDTFFNVKRFSPRELSKKELIICNGFLFRSDLSTPFKDSKLIYVLRSDGKIFVDYDKRRVINHSSLGYDSSIFCAGELLIRQNKIYELNEKSGHYRPKNRVQLMELKLKEMGAQFHSEYKSKNYEDLSLINRI